MDILIVLTEITEKLILIILLGLSIWSVAIMIDRRRILKQESRLDFTELKNAIASKDRIKVLAWCDRNPGFISGVLKAAFSVTPSAESVDRAVSSFAKKDKLRLEKGLTVLATLGADAPFTGLFGTVLGIIRSFAYLGSQSGSAAVMSGVSQALYATAIGLFVAIPAVVAYNLFSKNIRDLSTEAESLRDLYASQLQER